MNPWDNDPIAGPPEAPAAIWANDPVAPPEESTVSDVGKSFASAAARGLAKVVTDPTYAAKQGAEMAAQSVTRPLGAAYDYIADKTGLPGMSQGVANWMTNPVVDPDSQTEQMNNFVSDKVIPAVVKSQTGADMNYQPQTTPGKYAAAVGDNAIYGPALGLERTIGSGVGGQALEDIAGSYTQDPDKLAAAKTLGNIGGAGLPEARNAAAKSGQSAYDNLTAGRDSAIRLPQDFKSVTQRNAQYVQGMNQVAQKVKDAYGNLYQKGEELSSGQMVYAPEAKAAIQNFHDDLAADPSQRDSAGVSAIRDTLASFDDKGNVPLDRLVNMNRRLADMYGDDMTQTRADIYRNLKGTDKNPGIIPTILNRVKDIQVPEWGTVMNSADNLFRNYKNTFEDAGLNEKYSLADKKDYERAAADYAKDPTSAPIQATTASRTADVTHIEDISQYERMLRILPPEMIPSFTQDVIANSKTPLNVRAIAKGLYYAGRGIGSGIAWAASDFIRGNMKSGDMDVSNAASFPHLNRAIKHNMDVGNSAYSGYKQMQDSAGEMQPMKYGPTTLSQEYNAQMARDAIAPSKQLMLPAPPDYYVNTPGRAMPPAYLQESRYSPDAGNIVESGTATPPPAPPPPVPSATPTPPPVPSATPTPPRLTPRQQRAAQAGQAMQSAVDGPGGQALRELAGGKPAAQGAPQMKQAISQAEMRERQRAQIAEDQQMMQMKGPYERKRGGSVPTPLQAAAGNYKKGHIKFQGLDISIETPKGAIRRGHGWEVKSPADYGYLKRTIGGDGEHVDCYVGPNEKSNRVYVIDQHHHDTKKWDEHKVMLGFSTRDEAVKTYKAGFSDGKGAARIGHVVRMSVAEFKKWLKNDSKKPVKAA